MVNSVFFESLYIIRPRRTGLLQGDGGQERVKKLKSRFSGPRKILSASEIVAPKGSYCVFSCEECGQILAGQFFHTFQTGRFQFAPCAAFTL